MSKKSKVIQLTLVCSLAIVFAVGSFAARGVDQQTTAPTQKPTPVDCTKTTDDAIVKAVVENIRKGFTPAELASFRKLKNFHVGVTCLNGVVTLRGSVAGKPTFNKVINLVKQTSCVKRVNKKGFSPFSVGGCNDDTETDCCGDGSICVPKGTACPTCVQER